MDMSKKEKITLNGLPVYRTDDGSGQIKYVLFEDDERRSSVIYMNDPENRDVEYRLLIKQILEIFEPDQNGNKRVKVVIQEYEQSKRDKRWLQEPA